ncbi:MAG: potassium channel family protein [Candidatus Anammoxibacter sp.]
MRNFPLFCKFLGLLFFLTILFAFIFRYLKFNLEGEHYTLTACFYWVLTTMTTVGYGDIIFNSDLGRIFSIIVLICGVMLVFVALPYFFISFIIGPWIEEAVKHRIPRQTPPDIKGHVYHLRG